MNKNIRYQAAKFFYTWFPAWLHDWVEFGEEPDDFPIQFEDVLDLYKVISHTVAQETFELTGLAEAVGRGMSLLESSQPMVVPPSTYSKFLQLAVDEIRPAYEDWRKSGGG